MAAAYQQRRSGVVAAGCGIISIEAAAMAS